MTAPSAASRPAAPTPSKKPNASRRKAGGRGCQKSFAFLTERDCGLTASHSLSTEGGQLARLQAEKYFLSRTCRLRK
nr:MAG TPA: hypothetical protein [Caudoviricetes sp.]